LPHGHASHGTCPRPHSTRRHHLATIFIKYQCQGRCRAGQMCPNSPPSKQHGKRCENQDRQCLQACLRLTGGWRVQVQKDSDQLPWRPLCVLDQTSEM
jgi:hypothetical protein